MADIADYYVDKIIDKHISGRPEKPKLKMEDFWVTKNGDAIRYEDLEESHARNILNFIEKSKAIPHPKLIERVEYFDGLKKRIKDLF
jgi:hypothetical protein